MIGQRFNHLVVLSETRVPGLSGRFYVCQCDCGNKTTAYGGHLRNGSRKACGCIKGAHRTERHTHVPEYKAWEAARARCYRQSTPRYPHYGGRGIGMCEEWRTSFAGFLRDMGPRPSPSHSLDRINNDGDYEPSNCRWATSTEQNNNRSINRHVVINGERLTISQAARKAGVNRCTLADRLERGLSAEEAGRG